MLMETLVAPAGGASAGSVVAVSPKGVPLADDAGLALRASPTLLNVVD